MANYLLDNRSVSETTDVLTRSLQLAQTHLDQLISSIAFNDTIHLAFGTTADPEMAHTIISQWLTGELPAMKILSDSSLNNAYGAFSGDTNTIYLAAAFLQNNADTPTAVAAVLLEELGHALDYELNATDSIGDEGELFAALAQGNLLDDFTLQALKAEDDHAMLSLDGQILPIEQAAFRNPAFDLIGLTRLRNDPRFQGIDGTGTSIAVLDTGLFSSHPLLDDNYIAGFDFVEGDSFPNDLDGHGTHVAGTIGAEDPDIGVAPDVGLIGLRVIGGNSVLPVRNALRWVLDNRDRYNIVAVNMSLQLFGDNFLTSESPARLAGGLITEINSLIDDLEAIGVTVVSAAGNSYGIQQTQGIQFPAISSTINVGSVWKDGRRNDWGTSWKSGSQDIVTGADQIVSHSQRLVAANTLFAPGAQILSTVIPKEGFLLGEKAGTSMAAPHVAGAVALLQEAALQFAGRYLSPTEVTEILTSTADFIFDGDDEFDNVLNTGAFYRRLNIYNAVSEVFNRFQSSGGVTFDPNGTIRGAFLGPRLTGFPVNPVIGTIGVDGGITPVGNTDVDIIRFEVLTPGTVSIEATPNFSNRDDFDSLLRLFDANGNELAFNDNTATSDFSRIDQFLTPGVYYAGISAFNNRDYNPTIAGSGVAADTGNYALQFSLNTTDPNGLLSGAVSVGLGNSRDPLVFDGFIGTDMTVPVGVADVDLYQIIVPDDGTLFVDIDTPYNDGYVDSFLRLFDADGKELFFPEGNPFASDDDLSFDRGGNFTEFEDPTFPDLVFEDPINRNSFNGHTTDSFLGITVERGAVYYIGVSDFFNDTYDPTNFANRPAIGDGGLYQLIATFINKDLNGSIDQAIADRSLPILGQAGTIGSDGDPTTGVPSDVGDLDVDFIKVNSPTAGLLEINIDSFTAPSITAPVDTVVSIFDANGRLLTSDDDTTSLDPLLYYRIEANTDYYVAVSGYGNNAFDPFLPGSGSSGDTGNYIFNAQVLSLDQLATLSDDRIQNPAVQSISVATPLAGTIGRDGRLSLGATDVDLYRFVPTKTGQVNIQTLANEEFAADTVLRLFDETGRELAFNDDASSGIRESFMQVSVQAGRTYFIGVNGYSSQARNYNPVTGSAIAADSQGDYTLLVTETPQRQFGSPYRDTRLGTAANDVIDGDLGDDVLNGGLGNDVIRGGGDLDRINGGSGNDRLLGGSGTDVIKGSSGRDWLLGQGGNDRLDGGNGDDVIRGGIGRDRLFGGKGNDILIGERGGDVLYGGDGDDTLFGNRGRDIFVIGRQKGVDTIRDFVSGIDQIQLRNQLTFEQISFSQRGANTMITINDKTLAILNGIQASTLTEASFI